MWLGLGIVNCTDCHLPSPPHSSPALLRSCEPLLEKPHLCVLHPQMSHLQIRHSGEGLLWCKGSYSAMAGECFCVLGLVRMLLKQLSTASEKI